MDRTVETIQNKTKPESVRGPGPRNIREILLISDTYQLFHMEADGGLCARMKKEYSVFGLSCPPGITGACSVEQAACLLEKKDFDIVVVMHHPNGMDPLALGPKLKAIRPDIPVILFSPGTRGVLPHSRQGEIEGIDRIFTWTGNPEMLPAIVKLYQDRLAAESETGPGQTPLVLLVEDSPEYAAVLLPMVYKAMGSLVVGIRPRVLLATTHEETTALYEQYRSRLGWVISDTRFPRAGREDCQAGISIFSKIRCELPDLPLLLTSTESRNREKALDIPAHFLDKNGCHLNREIHGFFQNHPRPGHGHKNGAIPLGREQQPATMVNPGPANGRSGTFIRIGEGSMGGKARGLAFMADLLDTRPEIRARFPQFKINIPKPLVICTDIFDAFMADNRLGRPALEGRPVKEIVQQFIDAPMPGYLTQKLEAFLSRVKKPLAIRPSGQLGDDRFQDYAGLYKTYMIPNNHPDPSVRLDHLVTAVKLVWASACYKGARSYCRNTSCLPLGDAMAVIIQEVAGSQHGDYFYPALSGAAQSVNPYPFSRMKAGDGVAHLVLGLGRQAQQGLRFCPSHPGVLPHLTRPRDVLANTQNRFYALKTRGYPEDLHFSIRSNLALRSLADALEEAPVKALASTYIAAEDRIRDTWYAKGPKALTFARMLKFQDPPLAGLIKELLALGEEGMGAPVEMAFAVDLPEGGKGPWSFSLLQVRPMAAFENNACQCTQDRGPAVCVSSTALGHGVLDTIQDIVYVRPDSFDGGKTREMAGEISRINTALARENRPFLLAGPGRWGSSDPWLGIPVDWSDISGAGAIVEIRDNTIHADPSHGSHFFHHITAMGLPYITVNRTCASFPDRFDLHGLEGKETDHGTRFVGHLRLARPLVIRMDGKTSRCVIQGGQPHTTAKAVAA